MASLEDGGVPRGFPKAVHGLEAEEGIILLKTYK